MNSPRRVDVARILTAHRHIDPVFLNSPLFQHPALDTVLGCEVASKVETLNPIRSFKGRGAELYAATELRAGDALACASAGNLIRHLAPRTEIIGVVPEKAPALQVSLAAGHIVETADAETIADGIAARVPVPEALALLDGIVAVTEDQIVQGMQLAHQHLGSRRRAVRRCRAGSCRGRPAAVSPQTDSNRSHWQQYFGRDAGPSLWLIIALT